MYKVLIVEDMDITREDIMALIDWEKYGFQLLPGARNGKIGLEYAVRYRPDIILTDIKMPVMTGLDMITEIRKTDAQVKVILLTAYEEFELAKKALEMGVHSYVLKYEIDEEMLLEELNKLVEVIRKERSIEKLTIRHNLERILRDTDGEIYVEEKYFQWIVNSVLLDVWQSSVRNEMSEENLMDMLGEELPEYQFVFLGIKPREYLIFLKMPRIYSELERRQYVREFIAAFQEIFKRMLNTGTAVAIGGYIGSNRDLGPCRRKAADYLPQHIFYKGSCILEEKPEDAAEDRAERIAKRLKEIQQEIRSSEYERVRTMIRELFDKELAESRDVTLVQKTVTKLAHYFQEKGYEVRLAVFDDYLNRVFVNLMEDNIYHTEERFEYLLEILNECTDRQFGRKIRDALTYLREHYAEDVGLNEVAQLLDVTPIYLSHLFKKEVGMTFSAYVTKLRIDRAKELLRRGDKKIYEISEMVGYQTVQYFSKVFKRETNKTPKEFE